jgi:hypothetical protein
MASAPSLKIQPRDPSIPPLRGSWVRHDSNCLSLRGRSPPSLPLISSVKSTDSFAATVYFDGARPSDSRHIHATFRFPSSASLSQAASESSGPPLCLPTDAQTAQPISNIPDPTATSDDGFTSALHRCSSGFFPHGRKYFLDFFKSHFFFLLQKCRKKKLRLFFSWFDGWIVQYFLTLKILYIYWNVKMNEGKRWKLLVDFIGDLPESSVGVRALHSMDNKLR